MKLRTLSWALAFCMLTPCLATGENLSTAQSRSSADSQDSIFFNKNDEASTGMTTTEYYRVIKSTCEKEVVLAKKKRELAEAKRVREKVVQ